MHVALTEAQLALRTELRRYFADLLTPERRALLAQVWAESGDGAVVAAYREVIGQLGRDGWLGLGWPLAHGGQDRSTVDQLIFAEAAAESGIPLPTLTLNSVAAALMAHGTAAQRDYFLPRILAGELHVCVGHPRPDPGGGPDATHPRARLDPERLDGAEWVIDGQARASLVPYADWLWLACRTEPDLPGEQGLSVLLVPTSAAGLSFATAPTFAGATFTTVSLSDVRVPADSLVGVRGGGAALNGAHLRAAPLAVTSASTLRSMLDQVARYAGETSAPSGGPLANQQWVQLAMGRAYAQVEALRLLTWRVTTAEHASPAEAAATKVYGSEVAIEVYRSLMEIVGPQATVAQGSPEAVLGGRLERLHRAAVALTFAGGTNEAHRETISTLGLGVPSGSR